MQTTNLVNQLSTNGTGAAQRNGASNGAGNANNANGNSGSQFGAMLSSEMDQRLAATAAPAPAPAQPAPRQEAAKAPSADKPVQPDDGAAAADAAKPADTRADAAGKTDAKDGDADTDKDEDDATAAAGDPAAAMLALMASLKGAGQAGGKNSTAKAFDALSGGKGKGSDAAQLSALQTAMKSASKDAGTDALTGAKTFGAAGIKNPALAAAGADLADGAAAKAGKADAGFGAALAAVKPDARAGLDTAELGLQQVRDAANLLAAQKEPATMAVAQAQSQPAAFEAVQAAAVGAGDNLNAQVGSEAWNDEVGQKVVYMLGSEDQTAELTLNPPDLGPMQIVLSVSNDQASVAFSSNHEEVRQALENALPRLREMMSESGIALGNATVNAGNGGNGQAQDGSNGSNRFGGRRGSGERDTGTVGEATVRPAARRVSLDNGMVDTFA
jgi:flagellar hook-length control protein FliK